VASCTFDEQKRVLAGTVSGVRVICAYVPNGEGPESDKYQYKQRWLAAFRDWLICEAMADEQDLASRRPLHFPQSAIAVSME